MVVQKNQAVSIFRVTVSHRMTVSHDIASLSERYTSGNNVVVADLDKIRIFLVVLLNVVHELPPLMSSEVVSNFPTSMVVG